VQMVTEKNKVIGFFCVPTIPSMSSPSKPYSFFTGGNPLMLEASGIQYLQKFYPEAKTTVSMVPDVTDLPLWENAAKTLCPRFGLNWLGTEKFPVTTQDFSPIITRVLAAHKDMEILDTSLCGSLGAQGAIMVKQLRQAGYDGLLWMPIFPAPTTFEEIVPAEYRTKTIHLEIDPEAQIVSEACRDLYHRYEQKYKMGALIADAEFYNGVKAFFKFLNGRDDTDTTAWATEFEKYRWDGIWGTESYWVGMPMYGINRILLRGSLVSEYVNGKLETKWNAPVLRDLIEGQ
jgi:ABC-type branched-subunit amino acid transport system substrate-binding protein